MIQLEQPTSSVSAAGTLPSSERFAGALLRGPLTLGLAVLCVAQLATWLPHYLFWPWWADHDVFATMARAWDSGRLPYRDQLGNNFPGTIYVHWVLGRVAGWGATWPFQAFDAALTIVLGMALCGWGLARFRTALPGLAGFALYLSSLLGLDYTQVGQRDGQGPIFAVLALLLSESTKGTAGRVGSGILAAVGMAIRPQTILLWPALTWSILARSPEGPGGRNLATWGVSVGLAVAGLFAPIVLAGVFGDFLQGVRLAAYGGEYSQLTLGSLAAEWVRQLAMRDVALLASLTILGAHASRDGRRTAWAWGLALAGVWFYRPLSPCPHAYLAQPLALVGALASAAVIGLVTRATDLSAAWRLIVILFILGTGVTIRPPLCNPGASYQALATRGAWEAPPPGYRANVAVPEAAAYDWADYRDVLAFIRAQPPEIRIANVLKGVPALVGPTGRLSALPAESIAWLTVVKDDATQAFAESLRGPGQALVIWSPTEWDDPRNESRALVLQPLLHLIREEFTPVARFGRIEAWRPVAVETTTAEAGPQSPAARTREAAVHIQSMTTHAAPASGSD